jgi:hypothetical protein
MKVQFSIDAKHIEDEELRELVRAAWHKAALRFADIESERSLRGGDQKETPNRLLSSDGNP